MLSVRDLGKRYSQERDVEAVSDLSFELERGQFLAIVGRSGSGKSTLLGMIGGISRPSSGSILIDSVDQWALHDDARADFRNAEIGFVFQFASLLPTLRAIDNVALPALVGAVLSDKEAYARAHALLDRVGLSDRYDCYPGQLSGGEQRRVAIARALINSPSLLLADEPTADLDEETEEEILNLIIDVHKAYDLTLVIVTHNPAIAARANQLLSMRAGRAVTYEAQAMPEPCTAGGASDAQLEKERSAAPLHDLFEIPAALAAQERVSLGMGIERFIGRCVLFVVPLVLAAMALNYAIASYQQSIIDAKIAAHDALEDLAMGGLRADVENVTMGSGKEYQLSLYLENNTPGASPLYVLSPAVRAFVQVGSSWQEVPLKPVDNSTAQVLKITGKQVYKYVIEPDVSNFTQLLPFYMHVRITNDMLVSPNAQPKEDLIERNDSYYIYLKPHDADDAAILSKMKFTKAPPVWIPMPPH